jgi:DNA-binding CsgD family transcriptional regulator
MHTNLTDLIKRYTIKNDRFIKNICAPLKDHLGIPIFAYYSIDQDGRFCIMSNYPEQLDFFYSEKLYLTCPYLTHPRLFSSGSALIPLSTDPDYLHLSCQLHKVSHFLLMTRRIGANLEGFFFSIENLTPNNCVFFLDKIDLLNKFGSHFKREAKGLIDNAMADGYNLHAAKGQAFLVRDASLPLSSADAKKKLFLKTTMAISPQEEQCLELYKQGHSAQSTGAILGLSRRTVEHYFESIKNKLGCESKRDLLQW